MVYCFYRIAFFKSLNLLFGFQFTFLLLHLLCVICSEGSLRLTDASGCRHFRWPQSLSNKRHSVPEDRDKGMMVLNKYLHSQIHTPLSKLLVLHFSFLQTKRYPIGNEKFVMLLNNLSNDTFESYLSKNLIIECHLEDYYMLHVYIAILRGKMCIA